MFYSQLDAFDTTLFLPYFVGNVENKDDQSNAWTIFPATLMHIVW